MSRRGENIRKRSDGRWEGRYMICSSDGHKKYRSVYSRTYKGVKQKLMKFKVATVILQADPNETDVNHLSMTIEDLSQQWLSYVADHRKYSTYRKYAGIYEKYIKKSFGDIRTEELRSEMIASVLPKDLSSSLYQSIYCVFNRILDYGNQYYGTVKMHLVPVITKTVSKPIGTLNIYEQQKLVEYLSNDIDIYKAGILICLFMGLRLGDDDDKIRLNQRKPSKYKGLSRFGPEKNLQRINKFMKERPTFYKKLIQMKENFRFYLRCFYCITKVVILQFNSEKQDRISS